MTFEDYFTIPEASAITELSISGTAFAGGIEIKIDEVHS